MMNTFTMESTQHNLQHENHYCVILGITRIIIDQYFDNKNDWMNLYFRKAPELLIEDRLLIPLAENMDGMSLMLHNGRDVYTILLYMSLMTDIILFTVQ